MPAVFDPQTTTWYDSPATEWLEALPIGNGRLGAMAFGGPRVDRVQFNADTLWAGGHEDRTNPVARERLEDVRQLIFDGEVERAQALAEEKLLGDPVRLRPYQPFGDLALDVGHDDVTEYRRKLDLSAGLVRVRYDHERTTYTREYFASAPDDAIVIRLTADGPDEVDVTVGLHRERGARAVARDDTLTLRGSVTDVPADERGAGSWGMRFEAQARVDAPVGAIEPVAGANAPGASDAGLAVTGADDVTIALTGFTSHETADPTGACEDVLDTIAGRPYDDLGGPTSPTTAPCSTAWHCIWATRSTGRPTSASLGLPRGLPTHTSRRCTPSSGAISCWRVPDPAPSPRTSRASGTTSSTPRGTAGTR
jgi:alpha-L-fucosidase 2